MTLDTIDRAFVNRWQARRLMAEPRSSVAACEPEATVTIALEPEPDEVATVEPLEVASTPNDPEAPPADVVSTPADVLSAEPPTSDVPFTERLLAAGRKQWETLADEVEAARLAGNRVLAIVGAEPNEGRTTLVACLETTLRDRGRDVVVLSSGDLARRDGSDPADGGQLNDRRIVLVDAGIWFPPGLIRRERLGMASAGCDAAILVRRADREPVPSRVAALAAVGVTVLGEVVTFAPSTRSPGDT